MKRAHKITQMLFLNQSLSVGGAEVFNTDLLATLKKRGMSIAAYTNSTYFAHMLHFNDVSTLAVPWVVDLIGNVRGLLKSIVYGPLLFFWYAKTIYAHRSVDVLVLSGFTEKIGATFWAFAFGIPVVWLEFGPLTTVFGKFFGLPKVLYCLVAGIPELVIVPSENTAQDLQRSVRAFSRKIRVIPCGTSQESTQVFSDVVQPILICPSRLEKGKGQDILIEAFSHIVQVIPHAHLQILGIGDFYSELIKTVKRFGLQKSVSFLGRVRDVSEYMQKAQVVVFPSVWSLEGFGLVAIEAMALAKPVVAFDRGPTNEIVLHEKTGLLVKTGDPQALASAILTLMQQPQLRHSYGSAGLQRFKEMYTIEQVAAAYEEAFAQVIFDISSNKTRKSTTHA